MTPSIVVQDLGICLDSDVSMRSQVSHSCFGILRQYHSSLAVSLGLPVSRCCVGAHKAWLRKWYTGRYPVVPARSSPGGHECHPVQSTRPHHHCCSTICTGVNNIQHAMLVYECIHVYLADALQPVTGLPGRQRLRSSSTSALVLALTRLLSATDRSPSPQQELGTVWH